MKYWQISTKEVTNFAVLESEEKPNIRQITKMEYEHKPNIRQITKMEYEHYQDWLKKYK